MQPSGPIIKPGSLHTSVHSDMYKRCYKIDICKILVNYLAPFWLLMFCVTLCR